MTTSPGFGGMNRFWGVLFFKDAMWDCVFVGAVMYAENQQV